MTGNIIDSKSKKVADEASEAETALSGSVKVNPLQQQLRKCEIDITVEILKAKCIAFQCRLE